MRTLTVTRRVGRLPVVIECPEADLINVLRLLLADDTVASVEIRPSF